MQEPAIKTSDSDLETRKDGKPAIEYINLHPGKFTPIKLPKVVEKGMIEYASNNPYYFRQEPAGD
jgi:hypothetical protein